MENNFASMHLSTTMLTATFCTLLAFVMMLRVRRGKGTTHLETLEMSATNPMNYPLK